MASAFNAQSDPGVVFKFFSASLLIVQSIISYKNQNNFNQFICNFYFVLYCFI